MASSQVVLGLDIRRPAGPVIDFAFAAAAHRTTRLCVIHGWSPSGRDADDNTPDTGERDARRELKELLRPWREKFPGVEVTEQAVVGKAAAHLVDASGGAALLVVGRRSRHSHLGGHIGAVTHTVMHHSHAPVAVVPHG
jgi:nucleotide-binding universal stress UspA family protein